VLGDYRIGDWLIRPRINSMERNGETVHLEPKVMQVLLALSSEPGEVVTREQLISTVWPGVFVGDDVLIRAISELRRSFSDNPREPRIIQTVPKVGYLLIGEVTQVPSTRPGHEPASGTRHAEASNPVTAEPQELAFAASAAVPTSSTRRPGSPSRTLIAIGALSVLVIAGVAWTVLAIRSNHHVSRSQGYTSRPLTTDPGSELQPSFSPDGGAVAFVWRKVGERNGHIYVKQLGSESPVRLTAGTAEDLSPAWSPDGRWIAFIRHDETRASIVIIPPIGGSEEEVYTFPINNVWEYGGITWTADGKGLIFPQQVSPQAPSVLVELTINGRSVRALTSPPQDWDGDWTPAISPDGTKLAFVRGPDGSAHDVYVMKLPDGMPQRLTNDGRLIWGLTWASDSSEVVFSSNRSGSISLWRVSVKGGTPEHEPAGGDSAYSPSIAKQGSRLVYAHGTATWSILATDLDGPNPETESEILTSSEQDSSPHVSPAGDKIAFQSWRSGLQEIWTARIDGSNPIQLTNGGASAGSPSWSHDGRHIAFDARVESFAHIYVIDANGGTPRAITNGSYNDIVPSWSADDRWIYFGSIRSGSWQIWKIASDGSGAAQQVTTGGGIEALESEDAKWIYFVHFAQPGLWRCPLTGGPEQKIFDGPPTGHLNYWTVGRGYVYSLFEQGGHFTLQRIDPETGRVQFVHALKHDPTLFAGLSLTPDGKRILFAVQEQVSSGLTLVERIE